MGLVNHSAPVQAPPSRWELAAETIAVKMRWFGLLVGFVLVNVAGHPPERRNVLNAILALGTVYTIFDTYYSFRGRVFLGRFPLVISFMESLFIGLLCFYDEGLESAFRYYYLLSLICCAIRYSSRVTYLSCAFHGLSYWVLYLTLPPVAHGLSYFLLTLVILGWVTWASSALARLLKGVGDHLGRLNDALQKNQAELEARVAERTRDLNEAQAQLLHQEKMAAFGLLAAGIAHEVGNPLTSISAIVQVLQKRDYDDYTYAKLTLISGQMQRIRTTLRELIEFSRPASTERSHVALGDVLDEALNIAKYYKRTRGRIKPPPIPPDLPPLYAVRDQLVQVFLNLILNAIDATDRDGTVELGVERCPAGVSVWVRDDGAGIADLDLPRMFQPYFTTKKHGTGLGLFVTRKLVTEHDGIVEFQSRTGEGTVFRVILPLAETSPNAASIKETVSW